MADDELLDNCDPDGTHRRVATRRAVHDAGLCYRTLRLWVASLEEGVLYASARRLVRGEALTGLKSPA